MANVFFPNLDGDTVDASGEGKDGSGGIGRAAGFLALVGRGSGAARGRCCFRSFIGRHFLKRGFGRVFTGLTSKSAPLLTPLPPIETQ